MKVLILAGGYGTRLPEYTSVMPKPMVTIGGIPILIHIMNSYMKYGHKDFYVALGYKSEIVKRYFKNFEKYYQLYGLWIVLGAGFTPFPFKFITIASGFFSYNIFLFTIASVIARGLRFYLIAILLRIFGESIEKLIDKYFNLLAIIFFILLISFIVIIKYL